MNKVGYNQTKEVVLQSKTTSFKFKSIVI